VVSKSTKLVARWVLRVLLDEKASVDGIRDALGMFCGPQSSESVSD
jgi:hypothetical protein